jgi:hypothetical protein
MNVFSPTAQVISLLYGVKLSPFADRQVQDPQDSTSNENESRRVLICYSRADTDFMADLTERLQEARVKYYLDSPDISWGCKRADEVQTAFQECATVIVVISPSSLQSHWVPFEIGRAVSAGKRIIPLLTSETIELPAYIGELDCLVSLDEVDEYFGR